MVKIKTIALHCPGMDGYGEKLQERFSVFVIDPAFPVVREAEALTLLFSRKH